MKRGVLTGLGAPWVRARPSPSARFLPWLVGCLILGAFACVEEVAEPVEPEQTAAERPTWKPPPPPPRPTSCGVGCIEGSGSTTVRFKMDGGDHSASVSVEDNEGLFAVGPPINISENTSNWSGIRTFFNEKPGVYPLQIRATGRWTLTVVKGKQSYVDE